MDASRGPAASRARRTIETVHGADMIVRERDTLSVANEEIDRKRVPPSVAGGEAVMARATTPASTPAIAAQNTRPHASQGRGGSTGHSIPAQVPGAPSGIGIGTETGPYRSTRALSRQADGASARGNAIRRRTQSSSGSST